MKSLSYLNKYFYKYRWRLILGIIFIVINNYFGAWIPVLIGQSTDYIINESSKGVDANTIFWHTLFLAGIIILFNILKGFFLFLTRQTIIVMSRFIEFDLKNELFKKYLKLDYQFYKSQSTGDLMNRISEDVFQVRQYLGPGIMYTVNLIALFPFNLYQMIKINAELTFFALIPLPIMAVLIYFVSSKMNKLSKEVQQEQSKLSTIGQESFSGIRVIKAYIQEQHTNERFNESSANYLKKNMRFVKINALFTPTISLLIGASTLLSIYIGGLFTYSGQVSTGNILTFVLIIYTLTWPFVSVGWVTSIIQRAAASQERINEFLKIKSTIYNPSSATLSRFESLTFNKVSFNYQNTQKKAISGLNLTIYKGQTIGILGKTGSGKSTLIQLMVRQMDPSSGDITYNGEALNTINLEAFRDSIAVVPQDVFLFSDSIRNNIIFGKNDSNAISDEELEEVCRTVHVLHNINSFPNRFDTLLGERGVNLSGGQKQRISIARALIRKPSLLILDDCLSAVDTETEKIILQNLDEFNRKYDSTTIIVSHRISSLRNADYILILDNGHVAEEGDPKALLEHDSLFKSMHDKQLREEQERMD